jgi:flavorubredoxin
VPESVRQATAPNPALVTVEKMADGVYLLGGGPANSYMVEFSDFVAVFEAPGSEERSLAVIERITKLAPGKPIRWLISSHPHFDHIGGLRTYNHIGATVVTHMLNLKFLNSDVLTYKPRTVKPDILSLWPPTEVAEGYNYEAIQENFVITDNRRILRVYYVQPLQHVAGMLMAYLPAERIAFEADLFDTHEPPRAGQLPAMRSFLNQVRRMKLDVGTIAPVHGLPVPWSTFMEALGPAATP